VGVPCHRRLHSILLRQRSSGPLGATPGGSRLAPLTFSPF
jgi:hypothetical protein